MALLSEMLAAVNREGYEDANANAKVCQDVILDAIAHAMKVGNQTVSKVAVMEKVHGMPSNVVN